MRFECMKHPFCRILFNEVKCTCFVSVLVFYCSLKDFCCLLFLDRSMLLWNVKDLEKKEHKSVRANVELDHATQVKFSPDSKYEMLLEYLKAFKIIQLEANLNLPYSS